MKHEVDGYYFQVGSRGTIDLYNSDGIQVLRSEGNEAWEIRQENGQINLSSESTVVYDVSSEGSEYVSFRYRHDLCDVVQEVHFHERGIDSRLVIKNTLSSTLKYVYGLPGLSFNVEELGEFLFPKTYGVSLQKTFFEQQRSISVGYPGPMDFMHLNGRSVSVSFFGIQAIHDRTPYELHEPYLVPGRLRVSGHRRGSSAFGLIRHGWNTWVPKGETFTTPWYRVQVGLTWADAIQQYGVLNGITRTFSDKLRQYGAENSYLSERFMSSVLVTMEKDSAEELACASDRLPSPSIVHYSSYLPNGFDRYYPVHLPPADRFGTELDLENMHTKIRDQGHLSMPYTNYTWWCHDSPALELHGNEGLQLRLDHCPILEYYYDQVGYAASPWSRVTRNIMFDEINRFRDSGIDLLMIDQMSARPFSPLFMTEDYWWDRNPECPVPYAAAQGLADAVKAVSLRVPLSTEVWDNGPIDYLMNWVLQFCGFAVDGFNDNDMSFFPLVQALGHDKAAFTWHDLATATCALDDYRVTLSLLLGFQLNYVEGARGEAARDPRKRFVNTLGNDESHWPDEPTRVWLGWLSDLSKTIVSRYLGKPLTSFCYLDRQVMRVQFGDVVITGNLSDRHLFVENEITIAPHGFYAISPAGEAGVLVLHDSDSPVHFVQDRRYDFS